jgi:predicted GNAT family acetyltransferase
VAPIHHDAAVGRFTTRVDGHEARVDYRLLDGVMVIEHTVVPSAIAGGGVASRLTRAAFEHARDEGWKVRPACAYAVEWIKRHPQYQQLLV